MTKASRTFIAVTVLFFVSSFTLADEAALPSDWQSWAKANSPLTQIGALPDCSADVSSLPAIYQETVATYCAVKPGGPGAVSVLIRPSVTKNYQARNGSYPDGINLLLHLIDMKILFATEHKAGSPNYRVFKETGEEIIIDQSGHPLHADTCTTCHTGYSSYCVGGQCGIQQ